MAGTVSLPLKGGCHCGAVGYELSAPPLSIYNCHCTNCQKITGSAFVVSTIIREDSFSFAKGSPKQVEWSADSGAKRWGRFCGDCGSRIVHGQTPSNGFLSLRAGTFDDTGWVQPVGDIWTKSAQPWVKFVEGGLRAERQQPDFAPWVAAFAAQQRFAS